MSTSTLTLPPAFTSPGLEGQHLRSLLKSYDAEQRANRLAGRRLSVVHGTPISLTGRECRRFKHHLRIYLKLSEQGNLIWNRHSTPEGRAGLASL